jgi:membrane protein implicated in regulation of membrane protease activity
MRGYIILWIIIAGVTLGIDIVTSSFLFIWFTIGGIVSLILTILGFSFSAQFISFVGLSIALMAVGYPYVKKTIKKTVPITLTMEENYIGREFTIDKDIVDKATIKYEGIYWTVKNEGESINKGDKVKIIGIEGNKLVIKKL